MSGSGVQGVTLNYVRSTGCHTLLCEVYFVHSYELEDPQILRYLVDGSNRQFFFGQRH